VFWFGWIALLQGKGFFCFNLRPVSFHVDRRIELFACDREHFLVCLCQLDQHDFDNSSMFAFREKSYQLSIDTF
jgi:hypothetical protein